MFIGATPAGAEPVRDDGQTNVEQLTPGLTAPMPGKGVLPHREQLLIATIGGDLLTGDQGTGGDAFASFRIAETLGVGAGVRAGADGAVFLRLEVLGLAINHWALLGYADYLMPGGWYVGSAMVVPWRESYLRFSVGARPMGAITFGLGMEHDVW